MALTDPIVVSLIEDQKTAMEQEFKQLKGDVADLEESFLSNNTQFDHDTDVFWKKMEELRHASTLEVRFGA